MQRFEHVHLEKYDEKQKEKIVLKASVVSITMNILLFGWKIIVGIRSNSNALISDAVHSASDVFSTFIVMLGIRISNKASDSDHPYGHERLECVAAIILATILAMIGLGIGVNAVDKIVNANASNRILPGFHATIAAFVSIIMKEWMYWYTRRAAKKVDSSALMADAWHHRSDALSSVGAFGGIIGARSGYAILDPIASVVICVLIEKAAFSVFKDALEKMIDKSCSREIVLQMKKLVEKQQGVIQVDEIKTRLFGARIYVEVEIQVAGDMTLYDAHEIAQKVHDIIEARFPKVKHCMVHENPVQLKKKDNMIGKN